jgi:ribonuclease BN (tRNA processing enzyme)
MEPSAHVECVAIESGKSFKIDHFTITPFLASHSDSTLSFHVTDGKKTLVHLLDSEVELIHGTKEYDELLGFCEGADLVIFDAAYSKEDYMRHKGWGHSTVEQGVKMALECKPKRMAFAHFAQFYSDEELDSWKRFFPEPSKEPYTEFMLAYDGMELSL